MNQYEAMFLFDPAFGDSFENCESEIRRLMERADAELLFCRVWDERRLAYRVNGRKRGVYVLTYFNAPPDKIAGMERDVKLGENTLRVLIVRADGVTPEMMDRMCSARGEERPAEGEEGEDSGTEFLDDDESSVDGEPVVVVAAGKGAVEPSGEGVAAVAAEPEDDADDEKIAESGTAAPE